MSTDTQDWKPNEEIYVLPPAGHKDLGRMVFKILDEVIKDKDAKGLHDKWNTYYELAHNKPWKRDTGVPQVAANLIHVHKNRTKNALCDNNPSFEAIGQGEMDEEQEGKIHLAQKATEHWWREQEQQAMFQESVDNGEIYGLTIEKVVFNPDLEQNLGEVETVLVDPFHFGVYPLDVKKVQDAEAVLHFYPMHLREVKRMWPDAAKKVVADAESIEALNDSREDTASDTKSSTWMIRLLTNVTNRLFSSGGNVHKEYEDERVLVVETWVRDDPDLYPGGIRRVTACSGGQVVLDDRGNPNINPNLLVPIEGKPDDIPAKRCYLFDKFPFAVAHANDDTTTIWSPSDMENLEPLQREYNKTLSQITHFKDRSARPKIINPGDSGVDNWEFTNESGILNPASEYVSRGIRYLDLPNTNIDLERIAEMWKDTFFMVSCTFEIEQAQSSNHKVIAASAIESLIEQASNMIRGKIRNYQRLIRDRGRMYLSLVQNFYAESRYIAFEQDGEKVMEKVKGEDFWAPVALSVVSGSTLPRSKSAQRSEALEMYKIGAIDDEEFLNIMEVPNRSRIIQRKRQGPMGMLIERLSALGLDPMIAEIGMQVAQMDDKEFEKAAKAGELPQIPAITPQEPDDGAQAEQQLALAKAQAEIERIKAEVAKVQAEIEVKGAERAKLIQQAATEAVKRYQAQAGVEYDEHKLELETAETLSAIDDKEQRRVEDFLGQDQKGTVEEPQDRKAPERGLQSNNQEVTE